MFGKEPTYGTFFALFEKPTEREAGQRGQVLGQRRRGSTCKEISLSQILECQEYGSEGKELTWSHQGTKQMMKATKMVEKVTVRLFSLCFV